MSHTPARPPENRIIAEDTLPPTGRASRTTAMQILLTSMSAHLKIADAARTQLSRALANSPGRPIEPATMDTLLTAEAHGAVFRKLYGRGYGPDTTWDELAAYLPDLWAQAEQADDSIHDEAILANLVLAANRLRLAQGARRFKGAARMAMHFLAPDDIPLTD